VVYKAHVTRGDGGGGGGDGGGTIECAVETGGRLDAECCFEDEVEFGEEGGVGWVVVYGCYERH